MLYVYNIKYYDRKRATLEKPIYVKIEHWVYRTSECKSLCNILEDYKFLSVVKGRDIRLNVSDTLVHEKDPASRNKILLRIKKNGET